MASLDSASVPIGDSLPIHTQYSLSRSELLHGIANRILFSRFYTWLYLGMAFLSSISIILSIYEDCPSIWFILLEIIINVVMICEVATRFVALRKLYWKSAYNVVDLILVFLCVLTLVYILTGDCSEGHKNEEMLDTILLVARNLIQFGRLIVMLRKNRNNRSARSARIDFASVREPSVSIDVDAQRPFVYNEDEDDDLYY